jgi:hypothetical protein
VRSLCLCGEKKLHNLCLNFILVALLAAAVFITKPISAKGPETNWPQWRGPHSAGISAEKNLPDEWSATKNVVWKAAIEGRGHSSPIIWGKRVFLTTSIEGDIIPGAKAVEHIRQGKVWVHPDATAGNRHHTLKVLCLDRDTGKLLWERTAYAGRVYDDRHRKGAYAAPTPTTDGVNVYVWFGSEGDGLYCYDFKGNLKWKAAVGKVPTGGIGPGTSPLLFENLVAAMRRRQRRLYQTINPHERNTADESQSQTMATRLADRNGFAVVVFSCSRDLDRTGVVARAARPVAIGGCHHRAGRRAALSSFAVWRGVVSQGLRAQARAQRD